MTEPCDASIRLGRLEPQQLNAAQAALYEDILSNEAAWADKAGFRMVLPDGTLLGPFNALLYSPQIGRSLLEFFRTEKRASRLTPRVHEVVVLTVGSVWATPYEIYSHQFVARAAGIPQSELDAIAGCREPSGLGEEERCAWRLVFELCSSRSVDPETFRSSVKHFGREVTVDLLLLAGLYLLTCSLLKCFDPDGDDVRAARAAPRSTKPPPTPAPPRR